jgi:hypothetical protein
MWVTYNAIGELSHELRSLQPRSAVIRVQSTWVVPRLYSAQTIVCMKDFQGIMRYRRRSLFLWRNRPTRAWAAIVEVSVPHRITHTHTAELLWTRDQLVVEAANYATNTREKYPYPSLLGCHNCIETAEGSNSLFHSFSIHALTGIRTQDTSNRAAADMPRLPGAATNSILVSI